MIDNPYPWQWGFYDEDLFDLIRKMISRYADIDNRSSAPGVLDMYRSSIKRRVKYYGEGFKLYLPGEKLND